MSRGSFITFEGGEGVGKTTQIKYLEASLKSKGYDVVVTREPGGCPAAEDIRGLLFHPEYDGNWSVESETLMMFAARSMHIKDVISSSLEAGKTVLCDRYMDSTRVYQGDVKGMNKGFITSLEHEIIGNYIPDITLVLDLPAEDAMARVQGRGAENNNDRGSLEFYESLRNGFLNIVKDNPSRCVTVDASQDMQQIATKILEVVEEKFS